MLHVEVVHDLTVRPGTLRASEPGEEVLQPTLDADRGPLRPFGYNSSGLVRPNRAAFRRPISTNPP
jgi:hypothetical protein